MSLLTILWSTAAAACLTIGLINLFIWFRLKHSKANLLFSMAALGAALGAIVDLFGLHAQDVSSYVLSLKYQVLSVFIILISLIWFVYFYFGTGRKWLAQLITFLWSVSLIINFISANSIVYSELTQLKQLSLPWGETYTFALGIAHPIKYLTDFSSLLIIIFFIDSSIKLWRNGNKRRAFWIGGSIVSFMLIAGIHSPLVDAGIIHSPYIISFSFLAIIFAMALEISYGVYEAANLSKEVISNEHRWKSLLENIQFLVCGVDKDGIIYFVNPFYLKTTSYTTEEVIGKHYNFHISPKEKDTINQLAEVFETESKLPNAQISIMTKNGEERNIYWSNVIIKDSDGNYEGVIAIGSDITDKIKAKADLKKAYEELENFKEKLQEENVYLQDELTHDYKHIIGDSPALKYVLHRVEEVASTDTTILIEGETGVGKEVFARAIHESSTRKDRPLIKVDCASIPANLLESELFGHEKGAFTGADKVRRGKFELADGGTIFLDEIGDLPLDLQPKLLGVLESGVFERLGSEKTAKVDVRLISATNRVLKEQIKEGKFREDLFYRLSTFPISVPPLRKRKTDIPMLVSNFTNVFSNKLGKDIKHISKDTMDALVNYNWPGNVRELINVIERAVITTKGHKLELAEKLDKIPEENLEFGNNLINGSHLSLAELEKEYILKVLESCEWKISGADGASSILKIHPNTLRSKMDKLNIKKNFSS